MTSLDELKLSNYARRALGSSSQFFQPITTIEEIQELQDIDLLRRPEMGRKRVNEVRTAIKDWQAKQRRAEKRDEKRTKKMTEPESTAASEFASQLLAEIHGVKHAILTMATYLDDYMRLIKQQRPPPNPFTSSQWHRRDGTVYDKVALKGSPNAEEAQTAAPAESSDNPRGNLPPTE